MTEKEKKEYVPYDCIGNMGIYDKCDNLLNTVIIWNPIHRKERLECFDIRKEYLMNCGKPKKNKSESRK